MRKRQRGSGKTAVTANRTIVIAVDKVRFRIRTFFSAYRTNGPMVCFVTGSRPIMFQIICCNAAAIAYARAGIADSAMGFISITIIAY